MKRITEEWIKKAEEDYIVAERESKAKPIIGYAICFHARRARPSSLS